MTLVYIGQGLNALKTAPEIVKAISGLRAGSKINKNTVDLNQQIMAAQMALISAHQEQSALIKQVDALEKRIAYLQEWNAEKVHYELKSINPGAFAYVLKKDSETGKPPHWLCPACYNRSIPAILQRSYRAAPSHMAHYECPECKNVILVNWKATPENLVISPPSASPS